MSLNPNEEAEINLALNELGTFAAKFNNRHRGLHRLMRLAGDMYRDHHDHPQCVEVWNATGEALAALQQLLEAGGTRLDRHPESDLKTEVAQ